MLAPRTIREMTQLPKETQKNGARQTNQKVQMNKQSTNYAKYRKNTLGPTGLYELVLVAVHMENFQMYSLNFRSHLNCSPLFFS